MTEAAAHWRQDVAAHWQRTEPVSKVLLVSLVVVTVLQNIWVALGLRGNTWNSDYTTLLHLAVTLLATALVSRSYLKPRNTTPPNHYRAVGLLVLTLLCCSVAELVWVYDAFWGKGALGKVALSFYLAQYVPLLASLWLSTRPHIPQPWRLPALLDTLIIITVLGLLLWKNGAYSLFISHTNANPDGLLLGMMVVQGVALFFITIAFLNRAQLCFFQRLALLSSAAFFVGELFYSFYQMIGQYTADGGLPADIWWAWALVGLAVAGWYSGQFPYLAPTPPPSDRGSVLSYAAVLAACYLSVADDWQTDLANRGLDIGVTFVVLLVLLRQGLALFHNSRLSEKLSLAHAEVGAAHHLLATQARQDSLTSLPNRYGFQEYFNELAGKHGRIPVAIAFLDLDRMKHVNDAFGHAGGDEVLTILAKRIRRVLSPPGAVARFGGDEFVLLLVGEQVKDTEQVVRHLIERVAEPISSEAHLSSSSISEMIYVTASVGVASGTTASSLDELIHAADIAMYHAKQNGKNQWRMYDESLRELAVREGRLEADFRQALRGRELELHYQPFQRLPGGAVLGAEALLRWNSVNDGPVSPAELIPLVEERGLIIPLGRWTLAEAARQVRLWRQRRPDFYVTVNISPLHFMQEFFVDQVRNTLEQEGVDGSALIIEITETALLNDITVAQRKILALQELGVRVALDDFGTGYSSLSLLHQLPVAMLKLDRSFVQNLDGKGRIFVQTMTRLGTRLGLTVLAEGIENEWEAHLIYQLGAELGQGYFIGKPMSAQVFAERYFGPEA